MPTSRSDDEIEVRIALQRVDQIIFRDGTYRWIDMSTFTVSSFDLAQDPWRLLALLLADRHYYINRYDVADNCPTDLSREQQARDSAQVWIDAATAHPEVPLSVQILAWAADPATRLPVETTPPVHGPYLMSAIDTQSFERLAPDDARRRLEDWIAYDGDDVPSPQQVEGDLAAVLRHLSSAPFVAKLKDLGADNQHDYGYTVDPFIEFIAVDLHQEAIVLIAGGGA